MTEPALVILAAGASSRLGRCKATVDLAGRTPLERLVQAGGNFDGAPPLIVTGAHGPEIEAAAPTGSELLHNPDWARGRSGGLILACRARPGRDLCIAPVDVPLVPAEVFLELRDAWIEAGAPPRGWLAPRLRSNGRGGHPLVIGHALLAELDPAQPDRPLNELRARAEPRLELATDRAEIQDDLDTELDLRRLLQRLCPESG